MNARLIRFLGDTPARTLIKLVILSFVTGVMMNAFDWSPRDIVDATVDLTLHLWETGFAALSRLAHYLALGAVVIIPAFLLIRVLAIGRS